MKSFVYILLGFSTFFHVENALCADDRGVSSQITNELSNSLDNIWPLVHEKLIQKKFENHEECFSKLKEISAHTLIMTKSLSVITEGLSKATKGNPACKIVGREIARTKREEARDTYFERAKRVFEANNLGYLYDDFKKDLEELHNGLHVLMDDAKFFAEYEKKYGRDPRNILAELL